MLEPGLSVVTVLTTNLICLKKENFNVSKKHLSSKMHFFATGHDLFNLSPHSITTQIKVTLPNFTEDWRCLIWESWVLLKASTARSSAASFWIVFVWFAILTMHSDAELVSAPLWAWHENFAMTLDCAWTRLDKIWTCFSKFSILKKIKDLHETEKYLVGWLFLIRQSVTGGIRELKQATFLTTRTSTEN